MKDVCRLEDLIAWQLAVRLRRLVHRYCLKPSVRGDYKFRDNLADAASSAPRNIAEGWARKYHREFARFSPRDAEAYDRYARDVTRQCRFIQPLLMRTAPDPTSLRPR